MALPKINNVPKYSMKIPSTGKTITYRPFLVKEQKILLMAMESQDAKQILRSITDTIESCVIGPIDTAKLATFDVEYIFIQIRASSVGEVASVKITCKECNLANEVDINLQDIKIDIDPNVSNKVKLNDDYIIEMRYPTYNDLAKKDQLLQDSPSPTETLLSLITMSLDKLLTNEEVIDLTTQTPEDLQQFVENLTTDQFKQLVQFVENVPSLKHQVKFECISCKTANTYNLEGINDFF